MTGRGIVEQVLTMAVTRLLELDGTNAKVAMRLTEAIQKGLLKDTDWLSKILRNTEDSDETPQP